VLSKISFEQYNQPTVVTKKQLEKLVERNLRDDPNPMIVKLE